MISILAILAVLTLSFALSGVPTLTPQFNRMNDLLDKINTNIATDYKRMKWIYISSIFSFITFWLVLIILIMLVLHHVRTRRQAVPLPGRRY